ncbi:hypothetical protein BKA83DRAFT_4178306 [Pisolithus microcarpus]|nr:hypothetical protein BKA83DRAFT_4178306 [Pisolithus microcarpus]
MPSDNATCLALSVVVVVTAYQTCCRASWTHKGPRCDVSSILFSQLRRGSLFSITFLPRELGTPPRSLTRMECMPKTVLVHMACQWLPTTSAVLSQ